MKISESGSDNAKILSEFLFWITAENTVQLLHNIESPRVRLRCSAPSKDHLVHNLVIRQSLVCPNGLPVVGDVVYTEPPIEAVIAVAMLAERTAARAVHVYAPNFPVSSKGPEDQRKIMVRRGSICVNLGHSPAATEAKPYSLHSSAVVRH
jgi:hypothetical protein